MSLVAISPGGVSGRSAKLKFQQVIDLSSSRAASGFQIPGWLFQPWTRTVGT